MNQHLADFYRVWLHPEHQARSCAQRPLGSPGRGGLDPETSARRVPWGAARRQEGRFGCEISLTMGLTILRITTCHRSLLVKAVSTRPSSKGQEETDQGNVVWPC